MPSSSRMPRRFPVGTKYVLESRGPFVWRYIEFPNGRKIQLSIRKAVSCTCADERQIRVASDRNTEVADALALRDRIYA